MELLHALYAALPAAAGASLLLLLIGLPLGAWLARRSAAIQRLGLALILLPLFASPPVMALLLSPLLELPSLLPDGLPAELGHAGQLLAYAVLQLPAVVLPLYLAQRCQEPALDQALASLGIGRGQRLRLLRLPQLSATLLLALLLGTLYGLGLHSLPELIAARDLGSEPAFGPLLQRQLLQGEVWPWAVLALPLVCLLLLFVLLGNMGERSR